jgi:OOP family OmpA-OmpF porin
MNLIRRARRFDPKRAVLSLALAASAAAGFTVAPAASAQVVVLAPPVARYEAVPHYRRHGYAWHAGYWGWAYGRYVWVPGYWTAAPYYYGAPYYGAPQYVERAPAEPARPPRVAQVIRLPADALFRFDRGGFNDLLPGGPDAIADAASRLRGQSYGRIEVRGYTDRLGSASHNAGLSRERAETVRAMLARDGVPESRISAVGMGSRDPVSQCGGNQPHDALVSCLQPDRRVEIVAYANE